VDLILLRDADDEDMPQTVSKDNERRGWGTGPPTPMPQIIGIPQAKINVR